MKSIREAVAGFLGLPFSAIKPPSSVPNRDWIVSRRVCPRTGRMLNRVVPHSIEKAMRQSDERRLARRWGQYAPDAIARFLANEREREDT